MRATGSGPCSSSAASAPIGTWSVSWNIADVALFLDYERVPNRYDPQVYFLLNILKV